MVYVNPDTPPTERHAAMVLGSLMQEIRDVFAEEDWQGLRQSHFRVLSCVPTTGISVTELAVRVGMTKQGCGQFVGQLTASGHLTTTADPDDGRLRVVRRTPEGDRTTAAVTRRIRRIERGWAQLVGEERYATFRAVAEELATR